MMRYRTTSEEEQEEVALKATYPGNVQRVFHGRLSRSGGAKANMRRGVNTEAACVAID